MTSGSPRPKKDTLSVLLALGIKLHSVVLIQPTRSLGRRNIRKEDLPDFKPFLNPVLLLVFLPVLFVQRSPLGIADSLLEGRVTHRTGFWVPTMRLEQADASRAIGPREELIASAALDGAMDPFQMLPKVVRAMDYWVGGGVKGKPT